MATTLVSSILQSPIPIFSVLATVKGLVEWYAGKKAQRGSGEESSKFISKIFFVTGFLTPGSILFEIFVLKHVGPPTAIKLCLAGVSLFVWYLRYRCIRELREFYSVNVRIAADHRLITSGPYKYFRHPLYLIGIIENITYPLACGAWMVAGLLTLVDSGASLIRRQYEEKVLIRKFGQQYRDYMKATLW